jgi:hypothetical protein
VEQEVGGSSPPSCTSKINHFREINGGKPSQKIELGRLWEAADAAGEGAMPDFVWRPMTTIADEIPEEAPVLFLARAAVSNYDAAAEDHQIWKPVVGYGSRRDGWRDTLLSSGESGRREIELHPVFWAEIPAPLPYPPRS